MISKGNYFEKVKSIQLDQLPEALQKYYAFTKEVTEDHQHWDYYQAAPEIKSEVEKYFEELNAFLNKKENKPEHKEKITEAAKNPTSKKEKVIPSKKHKATSRQKTVPDKPTKEVRIKINTEKAKPVDLILEEQKFFKRCFVMHNKTKTKEQVLNFINALQRAIVEKRIRKNSPFAKEIMQMQKAIIGYYNSMKQSKRIEFDNGTLKRLAELSGMEKVRLTTQFLKRYIGIHGKDITKEKAGNLINLIEKNIQTSNIKKSDPYFERIKNVLASLKQFVKTARSGDRVAVHEEVLSGINSILESCGCVTKKKGTLGEIPNNAQTQALKDDGIMTVEEARNLKFNPVPLTGKWKELIGEFCTPTQFFVHGLGGSGKTTFVLLFTQYLASLGYKILYVAGEQYGSPTFTKLLNEKNIAAGENFQIVNKIDLLNPAQFDFVVLDSKDHLALDIEDFLKLTQKYPHQSFIVLSQGLKNGNFRGSERWRNTVDVMIAAINGIIRTGHDKNRWGGSGEMKVF